MISNNQALDKLVPAVISLSENDALRASLENNIGRLGKANADMIIAEEILTITGKLK